MKTTLLIKQHQKCLDILKMITRVNERLYRLSVMRQLDHVIKRIDVNNAIRTRLINYYANTFTKMCQQVQINETV